MTNKHNLEGNERAHPLSSPSSPREPLGVGEGKSVLEKVAGTVSRENTIICGDKETERSL